MIQGWGVNTLPLSWKIGAAVAGMIMAGFAWNALSRYQAQRQADEIMQNLARTAAQNAQQAEEQARQFHAQVAASLNQQQEDRYNTNQQVSEQARQYQVEQAMRLKRQQQEAALQQQRFMLGPDQKCVGGVVIAARGSSYSQATDSDGQPIPCTGQTATEPLR
ncbi:hypothetical protein GCM10027065_18190 [Rhodanobacter koreensis]